MNNIFSKTRTYFILCLSSIVVGLSLSKPLISMGLIGLLFVWLIDGNLLLKLKNFYNNKLALLLSSIYVLTLLGLIHTNNFDFAIGDVRRKMPLFILKVATDTAVIILNINADNVIHSDGVIAHSPPLIFLLF